MNEYEFEEEKIKKSATFVNDDQRTFWELFSYGAKEGEDRTFFTGNIQVMSNFMEIEMEKNNNFDRENIR